MLRFRFSYCDQSGRLLAGLIVDSPSPREARRYGAGYWEGYELDRKAANLIPAGAIGRMLNRQEVRELIRELETRIIRQGV